MRARAPRCFLASFLAVLAAVNAPWAHPAVESRIRRGEARRLHRGMAHLPHLASTGVLVFGSSQTHAAVSPDLLSGLLAGRAGEVCPVASFAFGGATPASDDAYLERILEGDLAPRLRLLVLEASVVRVSAHFPGTQNALRFLYGARRLPWLARAGDPDRLAELLSYEMFPLYRYRLQIRESMRGAEDILNRSPLDAPPPETPGEDLSHAGWRNLEPYRDQWLRPFALSRVEMHAIRSFLARAQGAGIPVALVRLPVAQPLADLTRERAEPLYSGAIAALVRDFPVAHDVRLDSGPAAEGVQFRDCQHMAQRSVGPFQERLADALAPLLREIPGGR